MLLSVSGFKHLWKIGKRILEMYHGQADPGHAVTPIAKLLTQF